MPPATLWLNQFNIDFNLNEAKLEEATQEGKNISQESLHQNGLNVFSAIRAPRGLTETISHVRIKEGDIVDTIALTIGGVEKRVIESGPTKQIFRRKPKVTRKFR